MIHAPDHVAARNRSIQWARDLLTRDFLIVDTETTALDHTGEVVELAAIDRNGNTVIETYVRPMTEINEKSRAFEVSGISNKMVQDSPYFSEVWHVFHQRTVCRRLVAYNADFDSRLVAQSLKASGGSVSSFIDYEWIDAMIPYSNYVGEWNDRFRNYKWQKLPGTEHGALADCLAVLKLLNMMAADVGAT